MANEKYMLVIYKYSMVHNISFIYTVSTIWKHAALMVNID